MAGDDKMRRGAKGGGTAYQRPDGLWVAEVTRGGVRSRRSGQTEAIARDRLAESLGEAVRDPKNPTVAEYVRDWVAAWQGKDETAHKYGQLVERYIVPNLGGIRLTELSPSDVRAMVKKLAKSGLKPSTIRNVRSPLSSACTQAVDDKLIPDNPAAITIKGKAGSRASTVNVSVAGAARLLDACRGHYLFPVWALCLYGGFRVGEALALTWDEVDLDDRQITVRRNLARVRKDGSARLVRGYGTPKSEAGKRVVPIASELLPILQAHREARLASGRGGNLLFPGVRIAHQPTSQTTALRNIYGCLDEAGLDRVRQHDLRHWCATLLIGRGVPISTVAKILGHANPAITYKLYAHVLLDTERGAADVIRFYPNEPAA